MNHFITTEGTGLVCRAPVPRDQWFFFFFIFFSSALQTNVVIVVLLFLLLFLFFTKVNKAFLQLGSFNNEWA